MPDVHDVLTPPSTNVHDVLTPPRVHGVLANDTYQIAWCRCERIPPRLGWPNIPVCWIGRVPRLNVNLA